MPAELKLPLTALVTSRNEGHLLGNCLDAIAFCEELIVIDLESADDTRSVAAARGARVVPHTLVPIAEAARVDVAPKARHDWLLVVDPDEQVPAALARLVAELLPQIDDEVAAVDAPRQYYFRGKPLRGTVWGGPNRRRLLVRRSAVELLPTVWGGMKIRTGFHVLVLPFTGEVAIRHDWAVSYRELVERHRRYLSLEPADRADAGEVTGLKHVAGMPFRAFWQSFVSRRGYRDGLRGLALSLLWAVFRARGELALLRAIRRRPALVR